jgi:hypothetical protein
MCPEGQRKRQAMYDEVNISRVVLTIFVLEKQEELKIIVVSL